MSTTERYGPIKLVDFPFPVGRAVRVKRISHKDRPDPPYQGKRGIVSSISMYPNARIGVEVGISVGGKAGTVWREYDPSELELA